MADTDNQRHGPLGAAAQTLLLFQAFITGVSFIILGWNLFLNLNDSHFLPKDPPLPPPYSPDAYPAVRQLFLVVFAAIILYILVLQWKYSDPHPKTTAGLEFVKGLLATAIWGWLLLDAILYIPRYPYRYNDPYCRYRRRRIIFTSASVIILCIFFYPLMFWRARLARRVEQQIEGTEQRPTTDESTPLLNH